MAGTSTIPIQCVERRPKKNSVMFCGVAINLSELSRSFDPRLNPSYLSRIFSGDRTPAIDYARDLAEALGMQLQAFLDGLESLDTPTSAVKP